MTLVEKIRNDVIKQYGRGHGLDANVQITLANDPPKPGDLKSETVLYYLGRIRNRSIYLMERGLNVIGIWATLRDIPQMKEDVTLFIPTTYGTARKYVKRYLGPTPETSDLFNGKYPGYLFLNRTWADNPGSYEATFDNLRKGSLSSLIPNDAFILASESASPILNGTTSSRIWDMTGGSRPVDAGTTARYDMPTVDVSIRETSKYWLTDLVAPYLK